MMIEDSDYLSIFDIELRKAQKIFAKANKNFILFKDVREENYEIKILLLKLEA